MSGDRGGPESERHRCRGSDGTDQSVAWRGTKRIQVDDGSEFISKAFKLAYANQVTLDFSRPGKTTDNPFIESFNGSFRDECLNVNWFFSLEDAKKTSGCLRESIMASDRIVPCRVRRRKRWSNDTIMVQFPLR